MLNPSATNLLPARQERLAPFVAFLAFFMIALSSQALAADPESFVSKSQERLTAARQAPSGGPQRSACSKLVGDTFDLNAIAKASAGQDWNVYSNRLKGKLAEAIGTRLTGECLDLLDDRIAGEAVVRRVRQTQGGASVTAQMDNAKAAVFVWRLRPGGALGWTAVDLSVDGRGLVATIKADLASYIRTRNGEIEPAIEDFARAGRK
ncbi:ABC transporter substrate-binding protein [Afifella pfennigii]|uniref:ABC transporter substrate-binding protein n=1 Tax=Afifella pfennigii TaxID=209897 RepID=UPI00047B204E|nr:ABC transporter substrate-binding protein [Afifella pfennigii]